MDAGLPSWASLETYHGTLQALNVSSSKSSTSAALRSKRLEAFQHLLDANPPDATTHAGLLRRLAEAASVGNEARMEGTIWAIKDLRRREASLSDASSSDAATQDDPIYLLPQLSELFLAGTRLPHAGGRRAALARLLSEWSNERPPTASLVQGAVSRLGDKETSIALVADKVFQRALTSDPGSRAAAIRALEDLSRAPLGEGVDKDTLQLRVWETAVTAWTAEPSSDLEGFLKQLLASVALPTADALVAMNSMQIIHQLVESSPAGARFASRSSEVVPGLLSSASNDPFIRDDALSLLPDLVVAADDPAWRRAFLDLVASRLEGIRRQDAEASGSPIVTLASCARYLSKPSGLAAFAELESLRDAWSHAALRYARPQAFQEERAATFSALALAHEAGLASEVSSELLQSLFTGEQWSELMGYVVTALESPHQELQLAGLEFALALTRQRRGWGPRAVFTANDRLAELLLRQEAPSPNPSKRAEEWRMDVCLLVARLEEDLMGFPLIQERIRARRAHFERRGPGGGLPGRAPAPTVAVESR